METLSLELLLVFLVLLPTKSNESSAACVMLKEADEAKLPTEIGLISCCFKMVPTSPMQVSHDIHSGKNKPLVKPIIQKKSSMYVVI